jgi:hypothetical protein
MTRDSDDMHETIPVEPLGTDMAIRYSPPDRYHRTGLWWLTYFDANIYCIDAKGVGELKAALDECLKRIEAERKP